MDTRDGRRPNLDEPDSWTAADDHVSQLHNAVRDVPCGFWG